MSPFDTTFGAALDGFTVSMMQVHVHVLSLAPDVNSDLCRLFGVTCGQAIRYYRTYPKDNLRLKLLVRAIVTCFVHV